MSGRARRWSPVLVVLAACTAGGNGDDGAAAPTTAETTTTLPRVEVVSEPVDPDPGFAIGARTGAYEVIYVAEDLTSADAPQTTERVLVRPPFESRLDTLVGPPPGAGVTTSQIATIDVFQIGDPANPAVVHRVPSIAPSDIRLDVVLDDGLREGLIELRGQRLVGGRRCLAVRTSTLLGAGPLGAIGEDEFADSCVDATGILLEEILHLDGEPSFRRAATSVDDDPVVADEDLVPAPVVAPVDEGGGSVLPVDPEFGAVGPFWELPAGALPADFVREGRYAVIPPQPENFTDETRSQHIVAGTADVFVRGADAIIVYQGATSGGVDPFADRPEALAVDGGELGPGELLLSATGTELRFDQGDGRFVHVSGSVPADELAAIARSLVETRGEGLVYL